MTDQQSTVLARQNVQYHGVWLAKYMVSDKLIRAIGQEFGSKPARGSVISLGPEGISLEVLPTADGKPGRTERIAFENLRDVTFNRYNMQCLMVVYVDSKNMFSIMVCSSPDERVILTITRAYKDHKTRLLMMQARGQEKGLNWTLREREMARAAAAAATAEVEVHKSDNENGDANNNGIHSARIGSNGDDTFDDDIFMMDEDLVIKREPEDLKREPVDSDADGDAEAFNVGVQTADLGSDTDSMISNDSLQSLRDDLHSLSEEMKAIKFLLEKSTGISSEEYYRRRDMVGNRHAVAFHGRPSMLTNGNHHGGKDKDRDEADGEPTKERVRFAEKTELINGDANGKDDDDDDEDYDLRSIGMQTDHGSKGGLFNKTRYLKRAANGSSTNVYREKLAASRKRSSNSSMSSTSSMDNGGVRGGSLRASSVGAVPRYSTGSWGPRSSTSSLRSQGPSNYVAKPIESVYQNYMTTGSRGFNNRRNKLIIMPTSQPSQTAVRFGSTSSSHSNSNGH